MEIRFEVKTPLEFCVRTSDEYWNKLVFKHPDIAELESEVKRTLSEPEEIRQSSRDKRVLLFYRMLKQKRWVVAVVRQLSGDGFLITAYQTNAIKEGELVWPK